MKLLSEYILKLYKALKLFIVSIMVVAQLLFISPAKAVETVFWVDGNLGVALGGYDPISYFFRGRGVPGNEIYEYFWAGAVWRFENEGNLTAFRDSPLIYAPQFGGFDATKMSVNLQVSPDPRFSDVFESRLYMFHSQKNLDEWMESRTKYVNASRNNWLALNIYSINKNFVVDQIEVAKNSGIKLPNSSDAENTEDQKTTAEDETPDVNLGAGNLPSGGLDSRERMSAAGKQFKDAR